MTVMIVSNTCMLSQTKILEGLTKDEIQIFDIKSSTHTLERYIENLDFIFCQSFQNLRLGEVNFNFCSSFPNLRLGGVDLHLWTLKTPI
jgi:hypothetical protein